MEIYYETKNEKSEITYKIRVENREEKNMNIIGNGKINFKVLKEATKKPELYEKSTHKFWDDPHIAQQMLEYHLNPEIEAASKKRETIDFETDFIIQATSMNYKMFVIDLGCGPGLYVDAFAKTGANVIGVDLSANSIEYAKNNIQAGNEKVSFHEMNYLDLDYDETFDVATLIYYDFCALSTEDQSRLLHRVHKALKPGGRFLLDVFTEHHKSDMSQNIFFENSGFWSNHPYWMIKTAFMYNEPKVECFQHAIINEVGAMKLIRVFHRLFSLNEIQDLLANHGFKVEEVFKNLKGEPLTSDSNTYGIVASKI